MVLILRGISTLPRLAVCLCFAKSLALLFPYASFFPLSSHHSCFPLKSHLLLNIPYNSMAQNESIVQTGQQHCSSQQGIVFKTKIINAVAVVCSAGETHHGAVLDRVLCVNWYMSWKTSHRLSQALDQRNIYLMDSREHWIELMGKFSDGWLYSHTVAHVLQGKLSSILVKTQDLKQEYHTFLLDSSFFMYYLTRIWNWIGQEYLLCIYSCEAQALCLESVLWSPKSWS